MSPSLLPSAARIHAGLPIQAGVGFKTAHFDALLADTAAPGFIEVHAENYMGAGGRPHAQLAQLRARMPLSLHGVGLSLGGEDAPDRAHLARLAVLIERYEPAEFSEHLAWSSHAGRFFNDLLPLRYDDATLARVRAHIDATQHALGRRMLLENPSRYLEVAGGRYAEPQFLDALIARTGCGLLLDLNNVHVSARNLGLDPYDYLDALPLHAVRQVHLAGHADDGDLLIDTHGAEVAPEVWALYDALVARIGAVPTLIEWDTHTPDYALLRTQAAQADAHALATGRTGFAA